MSDEELDAALCRVMATSPEDLAAKRLLGNLQSLPPQEFRRLHLSLWRRRPGRITDTVTRSR